MAGRRLLLSVLQRAVSIIDIFRRSRQKARREIEVLLRQGLLSLDEIATGEGIDELLRSLRSAVRAAAPAPE